MSVLSMCVLQTAIDSLFILWKYLQVPSFYERSVGLENLGVGFVLVGCFGRFCVPWKIPALMTNTIGTKEPWRRHCVKNIFVSLSEIIGPKPKRWCNNKSQRPERTN